ncbi:MAG: ergothioneine biosynthesis protein EgtB [Myxococcota bacterium]
MASVSSAFLHAGGQPPPALARRYQSIRATTVRLCQPLRAEDQQLQSMSDASPTKWHLAHTTWFFEMFILSQQPGYQPFHPDFGRLFNSYYHSLGNPPARAERGLWSRPSLDEVHAYRRHVDEALLRLMEQPAAPQTEQAVELGLHHEQQHQELLLTDVKHALFRHPWRQAYAPQAAPVSPVQTPPLCWHRFPEGLRWMGHDGPGFSFDNERPRHRVFVHAFQLASRLVTSGEWLEFMRAGGYRNPLLWLSDGWALVQQENWSAPLYWEERDGAFFHMTLTGMRPVVPQEPVCHVSFYEADAYARFVGARLPTEAEWETAAGGVLIAGNFQESGRLHPAPAVSDDTSGPLQMFGDAWEWTASPHLPHPGYRPEPGPLGEYNAKFMCNQMVLRGGSCVTPASHLRRSYRNFFPPHARWQFSSLRLARDDAGSYNPE